jgi:parallel beta-helix repeat protein
MMLVLLLSVMAGPAPRSAQAATVSIAAGPDLNYHPKTQEILAGDTVQWTLAAGTHTVHWSGAPVGVADIALVPGSQTFAVAGTYYFYCDIHKLTNWELATEVDFEYAINNNNGMVGKVTVFNPSLTVTDDDDDGVGTLRAMITQANAQPGPDRINFNLNGNGVKTIVIESALPALTETLVINGYTQAEASENTLGVGNDAVLTVELDGASVPNVGSCDSKSGLVVNSPRPVTIQGLVINRFACAGVLVLLGPFSRIQGSFIGTDPAGLVALPNGDSGVRLETTGESDVFVGDSPVGRRNLISGNGAAGVRVLSGTHHTINNNYIGTDRHGSTAMPNGPSGIEISAEGTTVVQNVISGHVAGQGIRVSAGANNQIYSFNRIGLNAAGTAALPNNDGIVVSGTAVAPDIGFAGQPNYISGNLRFGVILSTSNNSPTRIRGNVIGLNQAGTADIGNGNYGIQAGSRADISGNTISGNGNGLLLRDNAASTTVTGNRFGTNPAGTAKLGTQLRGIYVLNVINITIGGPQPADGNLVVADERGLDISGPTANGPSVFNNTFSSNLAGGAVVPGSVGVNLENNAKNSQIGGFGQPNTIAYTETGIRVLANAGSNNKIRGNSIHSNTGLGIDLGNTPGVTPNDLDDADSGPNGLQNFPVVTGANFAADTLTVNWTVNTTPGIVVVLDFFVTPTCDANGHGEGQFWAADENEMTSGTGFASGTMSSPGFGQLQGQFATMTATTSDGTSEFSACRGIASSCPGPSSIDLVAGATGETWCGGAVQVATLAGRAPGPIPNEVTAIFEWNNPDQQFRFWFRGFPDNFQTLNDLASGKYYFFQSGGGAQVANTDANAPSLAAPGTPLDPVGFAANPAGAYGQTWFGTNHPTASLATYLPVGATALFRWNNAQQQFNFWFRGFPDNFQTLTNGLQRGRSYFFQTTGVTINVD